MTVTRSPPPLFTGVYGILARNLVAKSGDNANSIILLDERGCPDDPAIFPSLQPLPGSKSLQGKFEAFKFSEDQVVRFQVNVQFCLEECKPVSVLLLLLSLFGLRVGFIGRRE